MGIEMQVYVFITLLTLNIFDRHNYLKVLWPDDMVVVALSQFVAVALVFRREN